jgi:hypothetical protein
MKAWNPRWALIVGLLVIVLSNAVALGGVWWNRRAPAESAIVLSERELGLPWFGVRGEENSGLALNLNWRVADRQQGEYNAAFPVRGGPADWLDSARMAALGFDPAVAGHAAGRQVRQQPRAAIFVLEFDGPAYRQALLTARENAVRHRAAADANAGSKEFGERAKRALEAQGGKRTGIAACSSSTPGSIRMPCEPNTRIARAISCCAASCGRAGDARRATAGAGGYVSQLDAKPCRCRTRYGKIREPAGCGAGRKSAEPVSGQAHGRPTAGTLARCHRTGSTLNRHENTSRPV